jgi:putative ABC transport system permease protein
VIAEALAVGSLASLVGVFAGLAVALAIRALFGALGVNVPSTGLVLESRTLLVSLGTGIPVTVAAGLPPAVRATRLSPVEALQQSSMPASRGGRYPLALIPAVPLALGGIALVFGYSGTGGQKLTACAAGAVMLVLASVLLSPIVVPAISRLVALPLGSGNRIVAKMARENATRAPARTALTAASLMIGLTLVLFVSVYESAVRTSATKAIDRTFAADFAIGSADGSSSIPAASARAVAVVPYVLAVSSVKTSVAQIGSAKRVTAAGIDPTTIGQLYRFDWVGGAPPLATLAPGDLLVERDTASAAGLHVGQPVELRTAAGVTAQLTVAGIYADRALLRGFALPMTEFDRLFSQDRLQQVLVKFQPGVDLQSAEAELRQALSALPGVVVRSEQQLKNATSVRLHGVLALFYALLAMSIVMALIGILNALTLAVHERTRELGLLRVVGMTPRQARSLVRDESVITAAIGTTVGLVLGVALAWLVTRSLRSEGITFELPWLRVALLAACGLAVGVLAAVPAAVKASRLDVLTAIAHE